jgi:hypothetical protein
MLGPFFIAGARESLKSAEEISETHIKNYSGPKPQLAAWSAWILNKQGLLNLTSKQLTRD